MFSIAISFKLVGTYSLLINIFVERRLSKSLIYHFLDKNLCLDYGSSKEYDSFVNFLTFFLN